MSTPQPSLIQSLFDLSFSSLIVPRLIKIFYMLALIGGAFGTLMFIITSFASSIGFGLVSLLLAPVFYLGVAILTRMQMEMLLVQFEIHRNIARLTAHVTGSSDGGGFTPPADGAGVLHSASNVPPSPSGGPSWTQSSGRDGGESTGGSDGGGWS